MTEPHTVISVRGDAQLEVAPDLATIYALVRADERSKSAALQTVASRVDAVHDALRDLGGAPITAGGDRMALGWVTRSVRSYAETRWDDHAGKDVPTSRMIATVDVRIEVRDFGLLDPVGDALARHESLDLGSVDWSVDHDNPGWPRVHADAIAATIRKARAYATALHATLLRLDHLADVGLLDGAGEPGRMHARGFAANALHGDAGSAPSLDPEPQLLVAAVEGRFSASGADLGERFP